VWRVKDLPKLVASESCIQHNPLVGDRLDGLGAFLSRLAADGDSMVYLETPLVVGKGDMVATLSRVDPSDTEMAVMDLFRVAGGHIVEQRDVMEPMQAVDELVNSGKF
jgi:predicted SnoaL-like aldol condensation-catalyzing enzyme